MDLSLVSSLLCHNDFPGPSLSSDPVLVPAWPPGSAMKFITCWQPHHYICPVLTRMALSALQGGLIRVTMEGCADCKLNGDLYGRAVGNLHNCQWQPSLPDKVDQAPAFACCPGQACGPQAPSSHLPTSLPGFAVSQQPAEAPQKDCCLVKSHSTPPLPGSPFHSSEVGPLVCHQPTLCTAEPGLVFEGPSLDPLLGQAEGSLALLLQAEGSCGCWARIPWWLQAQKKPRVRPTSYQTQL